MTSQDDEQHIPQFFVPPPAKEDKQEEAYGEFARMANRPVPTRRIYSITFIHDGEEWTATVGDRLSGVRLRSSRARGTQTKFPQPLSDDAFVLAIFPGAPYLVLTSHRLTTKYSKWENPFMAGQPKSVTYFSE